MFCLLKSIHWVMSEFCHDKILQSPPEIDFNLGRELQGKRVPKNYTIYLRFLELTAILFLLVTTAFYSILTRDYTFFMFDNNMCIKKPVNRFCRIVQAPADCLTGPLL